MSPRRSSYRTPAGGGTADDAPLLRVRDLGVGYGDAGAALSDVSLELARGGAVAILGSNGAGKSTLLRAVSGTLERHRGHLVSGSIEYAGRPITRDSTDRRVKAGLVQVPEGRRIFTELTVHENLRVGHFSRPKQQMAEDLDRTYALFPVLADRRNQRAGFLSGGEQQMLAIGRALMASPTLLLLDEPSLGLAPRIIESIVDLLRNIHQQGSSLLVVEQNAAVALDIAEYAYVLSVGRVALEGPAARLRESPEVRSLYLGEVDDQPLGEASGAHGSMR